MHNVLRLSSILFSITCCLTISSTAFSQPIDYKNELPGRTICIDENQPYAVIGPSSHLPSVDQVPQVVGEKLPINEPNEPDEERREGHG